MRRKLVAASAVAMFGLALSGCTTTAAQPSATPKQPISVTGTVTTPIDAEDILSGKFANSVGAGCTSGAEFQDVKQGSQIVVTNAAGKVVATGDLKVGALAAGPKQTAFDALCQFPFEIQGVPAGSKFYGVHVGNAQRTAQQFSASDISAPLEISISN